MVKLDPWGSSQFQDYARLRDEFGIEPMTPELKQRLANLRIAL